jgi:hypothetical protein
MTPPAEAALHVSVADDEVEEACFALRAAQYARHYSNIPADRLTDEFDTALLPDGRRVAQIVAATVDDVVVGTLRLVLSRHPEFPGLQSDVAELMTFDWVEVARLVGVPAEAVVVGELGRFAVGRGPNRMTKWAMIREGGRLAANRGIHVLLSLMPAVVERAVRQAGFHWRRVAGARLRRDHADLRCVLLRYHDYFLPALRKLGLDVHTDRLATASAAALEMMVAGSPDGPALWWNTPAELAAANGGTP